MLYSHTNGMDKRMVLCLNTAFSSLMIYIPRLAAIPLKNIRPNM